LAKEDLTMFDLSPLYRSTVGFERLGELFEQMAEFEALDYPPYNIERLGENEYRIAMAVAGFAPEDLTIEVKAQTLTIWNKKFEKAEEKGDYLHQGIARSFKLRFELADDVKVMGAEMENGMLYLTLKREEPEAMKPWVIPIRKGSSQVKPPLEAKKAA
jgi:molecular chaperone IbpA